MVRLDTCSFGVDRYNGHSVQPGRAQPCQSSELTSGGVNHPKSQFRNFPDASLSSVMHHESWLTYYRSRTQSRYSHSRFSSDIMPIADSQAGAAPATQRARSTKKLRERRSSKYTVHNRYLNSSMTVSAGGFDARSLQETAPRDAS